MEDNGVLWSAMQDAPGEDVRRRRSLAMEAQEQLLKEAQDTLRERSDANEAAAAAMGRSNMPLRATLPAVGPTQSTIDQQLTDIGDPGDPDDPENRAMNPGVGIGSYAVLLEKPEAEQKNPEVAIPELFERMKAYKRHLLAILETCREESTTETVDEALAIEIEYCKCPFSAISLRKMLTKAGALEYLEPVVEEEGANDIELEVSLDVKAPEAADESDYSVTAEDEAFDEELDDASTDEAIEGDEEDERLRGSIYDEDGFLVIEEELEGTWLTTAAGLTYLETVDPEKEFHAELEKRSNIEDLYYAVLEYCTEGHDIVDIVKHFESDKRLGAETIYASHIVDRLESIGALAWKGSWKITDTGRSLLAKREEQ